MKKILAAMLTVAMIVTMTCAAFAANADKVLLPKGTFQIGDCTYEDGVITVPIVCNPFTVTDANGGMVLLTYDNTKLTFAPSESKNAMGMDFYGSTFPYMNISANRVDNENSQLIMGCGVAAEPGVTLTFDQSIVSFNLKFHVNEDVTGDLSFVLYHSSQPSDRGDQYKEDEATVSVGGSAPVVTETPGPDEPQNPDETQAPDETTAPDETQAPDETTAPDTTEAPVGTDKPATPGTNNGSSTGNGSGAGTSTGTNKGTTTGTTTSTGSSSASSTTAAKTADTAPIVSMAVLALAAGTVVVAMRKRVNG